jgi:hypothetical protein
LSTGKINSRMLHVKSQQLLCQFWWPDRGFLVSSDRLYWLNRSVLSNGTLDGRAASRVKTSVCLTTQVHLAASARRSTIPSSNGVTIKPTRRGENKGGVGNRSDVCFKTRPKASGQLSSSLPPRCLGVSNPRCLFRGGFVRAGVVIGASVAAVGHCIEKATSCTVCSITVRSITVRSITVRSITVR